MKHANFLTLAATISITAGLAGCESVDLMPKVRVTHAIREMLVALCPDVRAPGVHDLTFDGLELSAYDGAITGVICQMTPGSVTGTHLGASYTVDICEQQPLMNKIRAGLVSAGLRIPEGCDEGSVHAAEIRLVELHKIEQRSCPKIKPTCYLITSEVQYYERIKETGLTVL
jgi:hypothetical protein